MKFIKNLWSDEKGEDVTEYALVLGFVALVAAAAIGIVGGYLNDWWLALGTTVSTIPTGT